MLLHQGQELDNDLGGRTDQDLALATLLSVVDVVESHATFQMKNANLSTLQLFRFQTILVHWWQTLLRCFDSYFRFEKRTILVSLLAPVAFELNAAAGPI